METFITKDGTRINYDGDKIDIERTPVKKVFAKPNWGVTDPVFNPDETITINGVTYKRHKNGGGFVSEKATVEETVWVGIFAVVHNGVIKDQVIIHDRAVIDCDRVADGEIANLYGSAIVSDSASVYGSARVYGEGYLLKNTNESICLKAWETVK